MSIPRGARSLLVRLWIRFRLEILTVLAGFLVLLVVGGGLMATSGISPADGFAGLAEGSVGSIDGLASMIVRSTPVIFAGLGVTVAYRAGVFNVGAEGQLYMGGLFGSIVAVVGPGPLALNIPLSIVAAFIGGALWALLPGYLKAYRGVNEIISTVLMNFIALQIVAYFVGGPFKEPGAYMPQSPRLPYDLPVLIPNSDATYGFILALILTGIIWFYTARTLSGLRMKAVGGNRLAARYLRVNDRQAIVWAMLVSGGLAGVGGIVEILGVSHRLFARFSSGFGFQGLIAAIMANGQVIATTLFSILLGGLRSGGEEMQRNTGVPVALIYIIQGLIVLLVAGVSGRIRLTDAGGQASAITPDADPGRSQEEQAEDSDDA
jgi:simple sugar transport system permease protein